jgi:AMMECR1 domain-containing protein
VRLYVPSLVCLLFFAAAPASPVKGAVPTGVATEDDSLPAIARETLAVYFGHSEKRYASLREFADSLPVPPKYRRCAGMFVTLSHNGKTRACWGSVNPQYPDLVKGTVYATGAAIEKEYRFHKVRASEWNTLKPQVTLIKSIEPITSLEGQNPLAYGLLVRAGGRNAILLPGEASDATYQLIQCKVKAGLPTDKPCQMYRVVANVLN